MSFLHICRPGMCEGPQMAPRLCSSLIKEFPPLIKEEVPLMYFVFYWFMCVQQHVPVKSLSIQVTFPTNRNKTPAVCAFPPFSIPAVRMSEWHDAAESPGPGAEGRHRGLSHRHRWEMTSCGETLGSFFFLWSAFCQFLSCTRSMSGIFKSIVGIFKCCYVICVFIPFKPLKYFACCLSLIDF